MSRIPVIAGQPQIIAASSADQKTITGQSGTITYSNTSTSGTLTNGTPVTIDRDTTVSVSSGRGYVFVADVFGVPDTITEASLPSSVATRAEVENGLGAPRLIEAGDLGDTYTLDINGDKHVWLVATLTDDCTITVTEHVAKSKAVLLLTQDETGGHTVTISDGSVAEVLDIPTAPETLAVVDVYSPDGEALSLTAPGVRVQTDVFLATADWTKPWWATSIEVYVVGGHGGGGSGRKGAADSVRCGGGGGGASAACRATFRAVDLPDTVTCTVGAGGTGGAAVTANDTNGNPGGNGGLSQFGSYAYGPVGLGGAGGTNAAGAGGAGQAGQQPVATGASASGTGGAGAAGGLGGSGSGGAGGGITAANSASAGGNGGRCYLRPSDTAPAGGAAGVDGADGSNPAGTNAMSGGFGGAGGGASTAGNAGAGGDGVDAPGGGGGAATNSVGNSGAGGAGDHGKIIVVSYG